MRELAPYRPGGDVSDRAVYFLTSLEAARSARDGFGASATYCMYDDGTPPAWHEGYGDCFSGHDTVEDRRHAAFERLRRERVPEEVAAYLSGREMCALPDARPERRASCEVDQTTRVRELLASHGADPAVRARLEAVLTAPPG